MTQTAENKADPVELLGALAGAPEFHLWAEATLLLVKDGLAYWQGKHIHCVDPAELERAFNDLVACGPMTRHCCEILGLNAEWISRGFIRKCESMA